MHKLHTRINLSVLDCFSFALLFLSLALLFCPRFSPRSLIWLSFTLPLSTVFCDPMPTTPIQQKQSSFLMGRGGTSRLLNLLTLPHKETRWTEQLGKFMYGSFASLPDIAHMWYIFTRRYMYSHTYPFVCIKSHKVQIHIIFDKSV